MVTRLDIEKRDQTHLSDVDRISLELRRTGINLRWQLARAYLCSAPNHQTSSVLRVQ